MPPLSEPWTQGELVRAVTGIFASLKRIEEGLEKRPDWDDINRMEEGRKEAERQRQESRNNEQHAQDVALKSLEDRMARAMTAAVGAILTALSTAGVLIVNLLNR